MNDQLSLYERIEERRKERLFRKFTPKLTENIIKKITNDVKDYLSKYNRQVEIEFKKRGSSNGGHIYAARIRTKDGIVNGFITKTCFQNEKNGNFNSYYWTISTNINFNSVKEKDRVEYDGLTKLLKK